MLEIVFKGVKMYLFYWEYWKYSLDVKENNFVYKLCFENVCCNCGLRIDVNSVLVE